MSNSLTTKTISMLEMLPDKDIDLALVAQLVKNPPAMQETWI